MCAASYVLTGQHITHHLACRTSGGWCCQERKLDVAQNLGLLFIVIAMMPSSTPMSSSSPWRTRYQSTEWALQHTSRAIDSVLRA